MALDTILDLDAMLDGNLTNVPDVPDFVTPPPGTYQIKVENAELTDTAKDKEGNKIVRMEITLSVASTLELADAKDLPVADGSMFSERFQYSEDGLKYFKRFAKNVLNVPDLNDVSLRDILATLKDAPIFKAVITHSTSMGGADGKQAYTNVRMRPVHEA